MGPLAPPGEAMHILFVHQNYPAQFGHLARYLNQYHGYDCTFVNQRIAGKDGRDGAIRIVQYKANEKSHQSSRVFEDTVWHTHGVYDALVAMPDLPRPDLIVGHSGFGSTLLLRELYDCPIINYFEYFYKPHGSDIDFRPDFPCRYETVLQSPFRNAMILLDLNNCDRGYSPTHWQHSKLPAEYRPKVDVLFDGVDVNVWKPDANPSRKFGDWEVPHGCKLVTYATRGMESMRGFDIFLSAAHRLSKMRSDVVFAIAGQDRVAYGSDQRHFGGKTLKQYILSLGYLDTSRFHFLGLLSPVDLARLFALSDVHCYLTVPFILSWSVFNALSCGVTLLASDTPSVREVVKHGQNGLLVPFFDEIGFAEQANAILNDPAKYKPLGQAGRQLVQQCYSYEACLPPIHRLYEQTASAGKKPRPVAPWL